MFLTRLVPGIALAIGGIAADIDRTAESPQTVFARGQAEAELKTALFRRVFGGERFDWSGDLERGTISFTSATKVVTAPVQVIGTYDTRDGTFLWGWDRPSIPADRAADARLAQRFGEKNGLPLFTTRKVECSEAEAWRFTTATLCLAGAQGAYRGPSGTTLVYMTFGEISIRPRSPAP